MTCPKSFAQPSEIQTTVLFYDEHIRYIFQALADISTIQKACTTHLLDCTNELLSDFLEILKLSPIEVTMRVRIITIFRWLKIVIVLKMALAVNSDPSQCVGHLE